MTRLQERLDLIRSGLEKQAPGAVAAVMHRATENLIASGIMERAAKEGQIAPDFQLQDSRGRTASLGGILLRAAVGLRVTGAGACVLDAYGTLFDHASAAGCVRAAVESANIGPLPEEVPSVEGAGRNFAGQPDHEVRSLAELPPLLTPA